MTKEEILAHVDHTLLATTSTEEEIRTLCLDAVRYGTASVCIPPARVAFAKKEFGDSLSICTVIGFPNGYQTAAVKAFEAKNAAENGADEIDMVIHVGFVKEGDFDSITEEITAVRRAVPDKILKVIIETCLLTEKEKIRLCRIVGECGADYIKTSTGFSTGGATREDVALFARYVKAPLKIKAAGGIQSLADAEDFLALGADRLGTSRVVKEVKKAEGEETNVSDSPY